MLLVTVVQQNERDFMLYPRSNGANGTHGMHPAGTEMDTHGAILGER